MNTPNPLVPLGTFPDKGKAQVRLTVFAILAIHVVLLFVLLIAGCNKQTQTDTAANPDTGLPPIPPTPEWPAPTTSAPPLQTTHDLTQIPPVPPPAGTQETVHTTPPPSPPTPGTPEPVFNTMVEHTVAKGESFYTLGKKYNVGYKAIAEANPGINPNRLKIGDKVKIPPSRTGAAAPNGVFPAGTPEGGTKTYKVRSGDNLMKIAKLHGVGVKQLRSANNLRTDQIKVGQVLKIPAKPTEAPVEPVPPAVPPVAPPPGFPPPPNP